jgi:hypothetical protein
MKGIIDVKGRPSQSRRSRTVALRSKQCDIQRERRVTLLHDCSLKYCDVTAEDQNHELPLRDKGPHFHGNTQTQQWCFLPCQSWGHITSLANSL